MICLKVTVLVQMVKGQKRPIKDGQLRSEMVLVVAKVIVLEEVKKEENRGLVYVNDRWW